MYSVCMRQLFCLSALSQESPACLDRYDLPAELEYILSATKVDSLAYVGHSQGTTVLLAALAERPDLNDVITVSCP